MSFPKLKLVEPTPQVATILVAKVPRILKLTTWFVKKSPYTKRIGRQMATK